MRIFSLILLPLALCSVAATAADSGPETKLAKALEGREAGTAVKCILQRDIRSSRIFDRTAILYEATGGTLYVNWPQSGASSLNSSDVMVTDTRSPNLCDIDVVKLMDSSSWMQTGVVGLGEFIPYTKVKPQE